MPLKKHLDIVLLKISCILATLLHLASFFIFIPFSTLYCIILIVILLICVLFNLPLLHTQHQLDKQFLHPISHFYNTWSKPAQYMTFFLLLYALLTLLFSINLLGNEQIQQQHSGYALMQRGTFIRDATAQEYQTYHMRVTRLFSSYILLFCFSFFNFFRFKA